MNGSQRYISERFSDTDLLRMSNDKPELEKSRQGFQFRDGSINFRSARSSLALVLDNESFVSVGRCRIYWNQPSPDYKFPTELVEVTCYMMPIITGTCSVRRTEKQ